MAQEKIKLSLTSLHCTLGSAAVVKIRSGRRFGWPTAECRFSSNRRIRYLTLLARAGIMAAVKRVASDDGAAVDVPTSC
jgi:hypothetical protein